MNISYKILLALCVLSAWAGVCLGRLSVPAAKSVETTKEVVRTDVQTVVHTVTAPNGQIDTTTTTTDHSQRVDTDHKSLTLTPKQPNWLVSGSYGIDTHSLQPSYGVDVKYRVLGPLFVGGEYIFNGMVRINAGMEF